MPVRYANHTLNKISRLYVFLVFIFNPQLAKTNAVVRTFIAGIHYENLKWFLIFMFALKSILKPLILLFQNSAKLSYFPDIWKRSNIIPVHKKNDKQLVKNYRPISLLPIFGKIFEKIIFNKIYHFLLEERLLNPNQSGFRQSDSCINQLLAITHEIFEAFDCNPTLEVRSVFLDISKAFDKVWHEGLLFKLRSMGISGELYNLLGNYLSDRFQRVILNGQTSLWRPVIAGVPQERKC